jgi:sporulation protein YabP
MEKEEKIVKRNHALHIENEKKIVITGVVSVISINEKSATLNIFSGALTVRGGGISINKLSVEDGTLTLDLDYIESVAYSAKNNAPILKKLFK